MKDIMVELGELPQEHVDHTPARFIARSERIFTPQEEPDQVQRDLNDVLDEDYYPTPIKSTSSMKPSVNTTDQPSSVDSPTHSPPNPTNHAPEASAPIFCKPVPISAPMVGGTQRPTSRVEEDPRPVVLKILDQRDPPRRSSHLPSEIYIVVEGEKTPYWVPLDTLKRDYRNASQVLWDFRDAKIAPHRRRAVSP